MIIVEKIKPILIYMGLKSYGHIRVSQGGSVLEYNRPLSMVPQTEVIYIQGVVDALHHLPVPFSPSFLLPHDFTLSNSCVYLFNVSLNF
jgi:hypothetical protein